MNYNEISTQTCFKMKWTHEIVDMNELKTSYNSLKLHRDVFNTQ